MTKIDPRARFNVTALSPALLLSTSSSAVISPAASLINEGESNSNIPNNRLNLNLKLDLDLDSSTDSNIKQSVSLETSLPLLSKQDVYKPMIYNLWVLTFFILVIAIIVHIYVKYYCSNCCISIHFAYDCIHFCIN